jgi:hypothetical protein
MAEVVGMEEEDSSTTVSDGSARRTLSRKERKWCMFRDAVFVPFRRKRAREI